MLFPILAAFVFQINCGSAAARSAASVGGPGKAAAQRTGDKNSQKRRDNGLEKVQWESFRPTEHLLGFQRIKGKPPERGRFFRIKFKNPDKTIRRSGDQRMVAVAACEFQPWSFSGTMNMHSSPSALT